jgi:hypothetical protein
MDDPLAYTLHRIPGLFRRWELAELMKPGDDYHIEDAGIGAAAMNIGHSQGRQF